MKMSTCMSALFLASGIHAAQIASQQWTLNRLEESEARISSNVYTKAESDSIVEGLATKSDMEMMSNMVLGVRSDIPTDNLQLSNGCGYVTRSITNDLATKEFVVDEAAFAVERVDASYLRTIGLTNANQSVQYVDITDSAPSVLEIRIPENGRTKDWLVYVTSVTNVKIRLPSATWWMPKTSYTNDISPGKPTALYFSQISDGVFSFGRVEMEKVVTSD